MRTAGNNAKEPVKIRQKVLKNGNVSLYLAIYVDGRREYEFLKLYLIPEKSKADKERNKQTWAIANSVKSQRIVDIQLGRWGFKKDSDGRRVLFHDYCMKQAESRMKTNSKGNSSRWISAVKHFRHYDPRKNLTFADITPNWVKGFRDYLEKRAIAFGGADKKRRWHLSENTRMMYFKTLEMCLRRAMEDGIIREDPSRGIKGFRKEETNRCYLTIEETRALAATECEYPEVKRAFLFSCLTGLRRSDISKLTWGEVTAHGGRTRLIFQQKKTGGQEYLDLTAQAAELIGERGESGQQDPVFGNILFPTYTNGALRAWALKAGIKKHITFHSGRHTFAVMMLTLGTDIYTVSKLLGHRDLKTTQIYAKIVDAKKQEAVDNIPRIL